MSTSYFRPEVRQKLVQWFELFGQDADMEIECRVKDVREVGFERVLASLHSNRSWSARPSVADTCDLMHATGVRETRDRSRRVEFLRKEKDSRYVFLEQTPAEHDVRFQVSKETPETNDTSEVHNVRFKQRTTFVHKNLFKFELTRVRQGPTEAVAMKAPVEYEVEIEYCGHAQPAAADAEYLADSLLMKASDLLHQLSGRSAAAREPGGSARAAGGGGSLREGDAVTVAAGAVVELTPAGQGRPPPLGGEMPAELVARTPWVFSHSEPDGRAHIMSLPTAIDQQCYPLYYFAGTVPAAQLVRSGGGGGGAALQRSSSWRQG